MRKSFNRYYQALFIGVFLVPGFEMFLAPPVSAEPVVEWERAYGGRNVDEAHAIQQTRDGGYIVAGGSKSRNADASQNHGLIDFWVIKLKEDGTLEWEKSLGGSKDDVAESIGQTTDGGYIVAGHSDSRAGDVRGNHGDSDFWILKLKANGELDWQKPLGGSKYDIAYSIQQTGDGGYIVVGDTLSENGNVSGRKRRGFDCWVVKLTADGTIEWDKRMGGSWAGVARAVRQTGDGGYVVAGFSRSNDGDVSGNHGGENIKGVMLYNADFWVVKLKADGSIEWQKMLGGSEEDIAESVRQTADGGYIVAGHTKSKDGDISEHHRDRDAWIVKLKEDGTLDWQKSFGALAYNSVYEICQTVDGGYIAAGYAGKDINNGTRDFWVVKLAAN